MEDELEDFYGPVCSEQEDGDGYYLTPDQRARGAGALRN